MALVVVGEALLVVGPRARSRAPRAAGGRSSATSGPESSPGNTWPSPPNSRPTLPRSASIAAATPGYCTLTATATPSLGDRPVDLADGRGGDRNRVPLGEELVGRAAQLLLDHRRRQLAAHRRRVVLQLGQRGPEVLGQALVEVADHLAELHQGALHVPELRRHLLGRPDLVLPVQRLAAVGRREHATGPVHCEAAARTRAETGQTGVATDEARSRRPGPTASATSSDERCGVGDADRRADDGGRAEGAASGHRRR